MREYPDPQQYIETHLKRAADTYLDGLRRVDLKPNNQLTKAVFERACQETEANFRQEVQEVYEHNVQMILKDHQRRMKPIRRKSAHHRLVLCPPMALVFGFFAWFNLSHGDQTTGVVCALGALAFLTMLVISAIFDR